MGYAKPFELTPLKVAYVLKRFPRFSETFILNEMLELERQGVEVEVFSLLKPPDEMRHELLAALKARITYLPSSSSIQGLEAMRTSGTGSNESKLGVAAAAAQADFGDAFAGKDTKEIAVLMFKAAALAFLAKANGVQHFHAHFGSDAAAVAMLAARLSGIGYSFTAHARDIYHTYVDVKTDNLMRRARMAEASFVTTVSDFNSAHLKSVAGTAHAHRVHRLYNGVDLSRFEFHPEGREPHTILSVGRLVEKKGFADLIAACAALRDQGRPLNCIIVGDGPLHGELQTLISSLNLQDRVELVGPRPQEDLVKIMHKSTIFALPCIVTETGDRDGLPTVLLEALAAGLPCISTDVAGVPEIITDQTTGLLVPPGRPAALANAMARLLSEPDARVRMAWKGREKAERDFDLKRNVATLATLFATHIQPEENAHADRLRVG
jgi:colanic acid/amylovoran biosynthesis glycosyltransferase